jgi:hypothetical protein
LSIGVGSGFRPEILAYAFPLWIVSAFAGKPSWKALLSGLLAMGLAVAAWFSILTAGIGGLVPLWNLMLLYAELQGRAESLVLGAGLMDWMRQVNRVLIWNGLAVVGAVWLIPWFLRSRERAGLRSAEVSFLALWLLPGLVIQALVHVAAPGHTLFSTPALCVAAAYVMGIGAKAFARSESLVVQTRETVLFGAAILNLLLFLNIFPTPTTPGVTAYTAVRNALAASLMEASLEKVRWFDTVTRRSLVDIAEFTPQNDKEPALLISSDAAIREWFMNWRIARYYLPNHDIWTLARYQGQAMTQRIRRDKVLETRIGKTVTIPIPCNGRILWLIETGGPFYMELSKVWELGGSPYVMVTSTVGSKCAAFKVQDYEFVPVADTQSQNSAPE